MRSAATCSNLLIIGLLDIFWRRGPILTAVSTSSVVVGALGICVISLAGVAVLVHSMTTTLSSWYISPVSVLLFVTFLGAIYMIYRLEQARGDQAQEDQVRDENHEYRSATLSRAILTYTVAAAVVVGAAIWLALTGDKVAEEMGWEASYMGTQFLALSTSLPELAASFAAIRLNAPELAITNLLGSNLFNMGFVLFLDDVAFSDGALWAAISPIHGLTVVVAVLMTGGGDGRAYESAESEARKVLDARGGPADRPLCGGQRAGIRSGLTTQCFVSLMMVTDSLAPPHAGTHPTLPGFSRIRNSPPHR